MCAQRITWYRRIVGLSLSGDLAASLGSRGWVLYTSDWLDDADSGADLKNSLLSCFPGDLHVVKIRPLSLLVTAPNYTLIRTNQ